MELAGWSQFITQTLRTTALRKGDRAGAGREEGTKGGYTHGGEWERSTRIQREGRDGGREGKRNIHTEGGGRERT